MTRCFRTEFSEPTGVGRVGRGRGADKPLHWPELVGALHVAAAQPPDQGECKSPLPSTVASRPTPVMRLAPNRTLNRVGADVEPAS